MTAWLEPNEDLLLEVGCVKFKKDEGILYITKKRIVWCRNGVSTLDIQHEYMNIKAQRISPDNASKVRLQIVLLDDATWTFHFNNPSMELQKAERERVKELLVQLLLQHKRPPKEDESKKLMTKELEVKQSILKGSEEMFIMYKTLVMGGIISAEEFWATPKAQELLLNEKSQSQPAGVTSAFLSEARPEVDGCNAVQYNLTTEITQSIFHTYPAIKRKHQDTVPSKMDEKEFWTKFFQSQYFHRDRSTNKSDKDVFSTLAQEEEETSLAKLLMYNRDPLLDLSVPGTSDEGFGTASTSENDVAVPGSKPLMRKYNHHSYMVCQAYTKADINEKVETEIKKMKLKNSVHQSDLDLPRAQNLQILKISQSKFNQPMSSGSHKINKDEAMRALERTKSDIKEWDLDKMHENITSEAAYKAVQDISASGGMLNGTSKIPAIGSNALEDVRLCYLNAAQILRHFWLCFPVKNPTLEEKVKRLAESITKFKDTTLTQTKINLKSKNAHLLQHLEKQLDSALSYYEQWVYKKGKR